VGALLRFHKWLGWGGCYGVLAIEWAQLRLVATSWRQSLAPLESSAVSWRYSGRNVVLEVRLVLTVVLQLPSLHTQTCVAATLSLAV